MKVYFSKKEVCFPTADGMRKFTLFGASGYRYVARTHSEEAFIESLPMYKRGQIVIRGEAEAPVAAKRVNVAPVEKPKKSAVEPVRGITKCSDAIMWLKSHYTDAEQVRTRADIHEFAAKKKIDFVDLAK